ncbi:MAG: hypothetical protein N2484_04910, partial [Clostridia bacterium]|nr:hypothetical protein [Clostridia bacterium]
TLEVIGVLIKQYESGRMSYSDLIKHTELKVDFIKSNMNSFNTLQRNAANRILNIHGGITSDIRVCI